MSHHPLLGTACHTVYGGVAVGVSLAWHVSMIIASATVHSSIASDRFTKAVGGGKVTALSVLGAAAALALVSLPAQYWHHCWWAIPVARGTGSVYVALNNYVAPQHKSHDISQLDSLCGVGTGTSPSVVGSVSPRCYACPPHCRTIALIQVVLAAILAACIPLLKHPAAQDQQAGCIWCNRCTSFALAYLLDHSRTAGYAGLLLIQCDVANWYAVVCKLACTPRVGGTTDGGSHCGNALHCHHRWSCGKLSCDNASVRHTADPRSIGPHPLKSCLGFHPFIRAVQHRSLPLLYSVLPFADVAFPQATGRKHRRSLAIIPTYDIPSPYCTTYRRPTRCHSALASIDTPSLYALTQCTSGH